MITQEDRHPSQTEAAQENPSLLASGFLSSLGFTLKKLTSEVFVVFPIYLLPNEEGIQGKKKKIVFTNPDKSKFEVFIGVIVFCSFQVALYKMGR